MDYEKANKLKSIRSRIYNKDEKCFVENCNQICIKSHVIQRSKFLLPISNAKQELLYVNNTSNYPAKLSSFEHRPISNILTFQGFCSQHDQMIFAEIEKSDIDFSNKKHLLLLNYRSICHELRKKLKIIELFNEIIKRQDELKLENVEFFESSIIGYQLGIKDLKIYKVRAEKDLVNDNINEFTFKVIDLDYQEIATTAIFGMGTIGKKELLEMGDPNWINKLPPSILISVLPIRPTTKLVMAYLNEHDEHFKQYIKNYPEIGNDFLNDILLQQIETWACSETFHANNIKQQEETVLEIMRNKGVFEPVEFNIKTKIV